jgi:hypothetical protein
MPGAPTKTFNGQGKHFNKFISALFLITGHAQNDRFVRRQVPLQFGW